MNSLLDKISIVKQNEENTSIISITRLIIFFLLSCLLFFIVIFRLAHMQIYQYPYWKQRSEGNRIRIVPKPASRGIIYDRKSKIMATNRLSYSVLLYPMKMEKEEVQKVLTKLEEILKISKVAIEAKLLELGYKSAYPIYLMHNADEETISKLLENQTSLPGIEVVKNFIRFYPNENLASHILGYSGEITQEELKQTYNKNYNVGDIIGKTGLEQKFDVELRGKAGGDYIEVDAAGKPITTLKTEKAVQGNSLQLTIDSDIQAIAESALDKKKGAIVVIQPFTGEIFALVSKPDFNPNIFSDKVSQKEWNVLQKSNDHPFLNRALTVYPPGSIFKIITAVAAIEKEKLSITRYFHSTGSLKVGNRIFYDWNRGGFGWVNIEKALAYSIDTVFYQLGVEMGIYPIKMYANLFNLGVLTGIELPGELPGTIPDDTWKQQNFNEQWYPGDTANASIGQGFIQMSPLQGAIMISTIANEGNIIQPFIVKSIIDSNGQLLKNYTPQQTRKLPVSPNTIEIVKQGLKSAVAYGTASALQISGIRVAAKTGTAEDPPRKKPHSWVVAYAPAENPTVAICVFVEQGGGGGAVAAPIAKKVLLKVFENKNTKK